MSKVMVLNGPNLNRLGSREPEIYGTGNFAELTAVAEKACAERGLTADVRQTNSEAELIVVLNPAAFTHYSYALRDAAALVTKAGLKLIEVHLSNPHSREEFRHMSVISGVATGVIAGFGFESYVLAIKAL
jgi:3-dehydroquinate dehydratase-2